MVTSNRVGPYELLYPIGAGGMAETFVAVRRGPVGFEQRVCLKRILPGHTAEPTLVELFLDEARLLAQLRNAGIAQVYDFGEADGTYYMALELIDGADLEAVQQSMARRGLRIPSELAAHIIAQLLAALDYAHNLTADGEPLHIVHRDVTPSNILVSLNGEIKLTDFGIAKARGRKHKTQTGHTKGKLAYMSPEQVRGEALDARSDLFAVGVVLYELLAGEHPFHADTDLALLHKILESRRKPLRELAPMAPEPLIALVDDLLEADAARRPPSAQAALARITFSKPPFALQKELASLVSFHREHSPKKSPAVPTPPDTAALQKRSGSSPRSGSGPRDGATLALPDARTTSDQLAYARATGTRERVTGGSRRVLALSAAAALAVAGTIAWFMTGGPAESKVQVPPIPSAPSVAATAKAPPETVTPASAPVAASPSAAADVPTPGNLPTPPAEARPEADAPIVLHEPTEGAKVPRASGTGTSRRSPRRTQQAQPGVERPAPTPAGPGPSTAAPKGTKGRTGALSPDEF